MAREAGNDTTRKQAGSELVARAEQQLRWRQAQGEVDATGRRI
jgi:hypothetical protein